MASLYKKVISGKPYWYLREMGWVDGKPKLVSERYLGTAADIEALLDAREQQMLPERTRHLDFGAVAAAWGLLADLGVAAVIDEETGARPPGLPLSPGTYLALAALNRVTDPCSKRGFADWWRTTAADRFTKIPASALDHRRFWDAMHAVPLEALPRIEEKLAAAACARFGLDTGSVALDMTNFATFIDTGNGRAPIAQRGKAKQKRADLRLVGLGLVVTRDGGIPLLSHAYPGNKPDVTQFPVMIQALAARHAALAAATGQAGTEMTVVFDAGQNSEANFALLAGTGLRVLLLDRQAFPRDKPCAGWITPAVVEELQIDLDDYRRGRVLEPLTGFCVSLMGGPEVEANHGRLLGLFPINLLHNLVHLLVGLWGLAGARSFSGALGFARGLAIFYGLLVVLGLIPGTDTLFGLVPIQGHDVWLHALSAAVAALLWLWAAGARRRSVRLTKGGELNRTHGFAPGQPGFRSPRRGVGRTPKPGSLSRPWAFRALGLRRGGWAGLLPASNARDNQPCLKTDPAPPSGGTGRGHAAAPQRCHLERSCGPAAPRCGRNL